MAHDGRFGSSRNEKQAKTMSQDKCLPLPETITQHTKREPEKRFALCVFKDFRIIIRQGMYGCVLMCVRTLDKRYPVVSKLVCRRWLQQHHALIEQRHTKGNNHKQRQAVSGTTKSRYITTAGIRGSIACLLSRLSVCGYFRRLSIHSICPYSVASDVQCSLMGVISASLGHVSVFHTA